MRVLWFWHIEGASSIGNLMKIPPTQNLSVTESNERFVAEKICALPISMRVQWYIDRSKIWLRNELGIFAILQLTYPVFVAWDSWRLPHRSMDYITLFHVGVKLKHESRKFNARGLFSCVEETLKIVQSDKLVLFTEIETGMVP